MNISYRESGLMDKKYEEWMKNTPVWVDSLNASEDNWCDELKPRADGHGEIRFALFYHLLKHSPRVHM